MENKREELIKYVDGCMEYNLPMNRLTYFCFRLGNGSLVKDLIRSIQIKLNKN